MRTAAQRGWKLHDYQEVARDFLGTGTGGRGLFLDMGLGKTASSLAALSPEHLPVLVVAPKKVAESVWPHETALWRPDLRIRVAAGSSTPTRTATELRQDALADNDADIVVVSRDNFADALKVRRRRKFRTVIIDELSGYKSASSARFRVLKKVATRAAVKHVWGLSGTPAPNGLLDLWSQLYVLDGGIRLGGTLKGYRELHFTPGRRMPSGVVTSWDLIDGHEEQIYGAIDDICLSMATEGRIELPPVTYNYIDIEMPPKARKVYLELKRELLVNLIEIFGGEVHSAAHAGDLSGKLSSLAAGFIYVDDAALRGGAYTWVHDAKLDAVEEVISNTLSPVLVFYQFRAELEHLEARFPTARSIHERGVIEDWNEGKVPILLAHPASAGHGLNLQYGGRTIVWSSLTWSLEEWEQGNKRLLRQGQTHPVVIHVIMAKRTVDQIKRARLEGKALTQNALLDHLESPL